MVDMRFWNDAPCYFRYHSQVTWSVRGLRPFGTLRLLLTSSAVAATRLLNVNCQSGNNIDSETVLIDTRILGLLSKATVYGQSQRFASIVC